ncbi:hypothetical protein ACIRQQ_17445 [Streptomyces fuscichromogenes]|uniref:hypothetical protein n=1 Tax=Streptomyces fuscichromogenes TaxID=1324013 RepID=UPI00382483F3
MAARLADGHCLDAGPALIPRWMTALDQCRERGAPVRVFTDVGARIRDEAAGMTRPQRPSPGMRRR